MITTTHKVEITVNECHAPGYFTASYAAAMALFKEGCIDSGSHYGDGVVTEWAVFKNLEDAVVCHHSLSAYLGCEV